MSTIQERRRRLHALAAAITFGIVASMIGVLVASNRAALALRYRGQGAEWVVVGCTVIADLLLVAIIYRLCYEVLFAVMERRRLGYPFPALLAGLLSIYTLALWTLLTPTLARIGLALDWALFTEGWAEPESQLLRIAVVFAFVALSFYFIVWRYRRGGLVEAVRAFVVDMRSRREERRADDAL